MKRKRHTPGEIIKKLREAGGLLAAGKDVEEVFRAHGVSAATYQRWKSYYWGVKNDALKRLRELEKQNARLKRAVADLTFGDIAPLPYNHHHAILRKAPPRSGLVQLADRQTGRITCSPNNKTTI
jgi:hypothetical protein